MLVDHFARGTARAWYLCKTENVSDPFTTVEDYIKNYKCISNNLLCYYSLHLLGLLVSVIIQDLKVDMNTFIVSNSLILYLSDSVSIQILYQRDVKYQMLLRCISISRIVYDIYSFRALNANFVLFIEIIYLMQ